MPVRAELLSIEAYRRSARVRDLTDPGQGAHALQLLVDEATSALTRGWGAQLIVRRANPIVPIEDNYDACTTRPTAPLATHAIRAT